MWRRRSIICGLLLCILLCLGGCVFLRLLEVKRQLCTFSQHFRIHDQNGLSLIFLSPVLFEQDVLYVAKRSPTALEKSDRTSQWHYQFLKEPRMGDDQRGRFDLPVDFFFQDNKLTAVRLPHRFIEILAAPFIIEAFRAIGRSEINRQERFAFGSFYEKDASKRNDIPRKDDLLKLLGKPGLEQNSGGETVLTYTYRLKPNEKDSGVPPSYAWARFTFPLGFDTLLKAEAQFSIIRLSMEFS